MRFAASIRRPIVTAVLVAAVSAVPTPSHATADEGVPRAFLEAQGERQRGRLGTSQEGRPAGEDICSSGIGDGTWQFPRGMPVRSGRVRASIELRRSDRPDAVTLRRWSGVNEFGQPSGDSRAIRFRMRAGDGAWLLRFRQRVRDHLYLSLRARWAGECGGDSGTWLFHLEAR